MNPRSSDIVDANDDQGLNSTGENKIVGGVTDVPVHSGDKSRCAVEKILAVVEIKDGEATLRLLVIAGRDVDNEIALVAEKARAKLFMFA